MLKLLLVGHDDKALSELESALKEYDDVELRRAESGEAALQMASNNRIDLVITDERLNDMTGLEFAGKLLLVNPMINCACVSPLSPGKFHEASEGLGVMGQLPSRPGKKDAEELLRNLRHVKGLMGGA
ncbi:response regulator [Thermodesulfobacteriota bacterium]